MAKISQICDETSNGMLKGVPSIVANMAKMTNLAKIRQRCGELLMRCSKGPV